MRYWHWMIVVSLGGLLPGTSCGDDIPLAVDPATGTLATSLPGSALLPESGRAYRWQLDHSLQAASYSNPSPRPLAELEFRDDNALLRVAGLRGLSLFTLAEYGKTRLYLGVNGDGVIGLHLSANPRYRDEQYLELIRMPYLKKSTPVR